MMARTTNPRMIQRRLLFGAFLAGTLLLQACATGGSNPFVESTNQDVFLLRVESRNNFEVNVYMNPSGKRELIGTVPANGLEFFEFGYPAGRPLSIELQTRLGDRYRIPSTPFPGGGRVDLVVLSDIRRSGFVRRDS